MANAFLILCCVLMCQDLVKELKSETSGNFKTVLAGLCMSPAHFDCDQLKKAMKVRRPDFSFI